MISSIARAAQRFLARTIAVVALVGPAQAAECGLRDKVKSFLESRYHEKVNAVGTIGTATVVGAMELYVSETGTWTVLLSRPNGISCIVAAGQNFENVPAVYGKRPEATPF